ncbi:hypothetical protein SAMN05421676_10425 [Salinibacillus kushneri]|uniref:Uncharacterized protein n=1 Tax=Salinibacillus kushneri TaxID=237682 RepID=A0A1I0DJW3_9BACI|nr:hypothetical protein [Salinibacillus kushneri]SET31933.1 hypothetical protein SAMN05421676_10425 [Salinibacillus kushneri]
MNILAMRTALSIKAKNGVAFLFAASILWSLITVVFLLPIDLYSKNIYLLWSTGAMFPLALLFSKLFKAEWKSDDSPIGLLGLYLNLAQLMYFPIVIWAMVQSPSHMILFFAIVTGAHFFPYGWFYHAKAYFIMSPIISISILMIGWNLPLKHLWLIASMMVVFLIILSIWLYMDYKNKKSCSNQLR